MNLIANKSSIQSLILICVFSMTLVITPWSNFDSFNLGKFTILVISSFALTGVLIFSIKSTLFPALHKLLLATTAFIICLFLAYFVGGSANTAQLYGVFGRNTGLLSYLSLSVLMFAAALVFTMGFAKKVLWILVFTGFANVVYGLVQWSGRDPIEWGNPYNPIIGTFGNPNFASSFLAIAGLAALALVIDFQALPIRIFLAVDIGLSLFLIYHSDSIQGLSIFVLGTTLTVFLKFVRVQKRLWLSTLYWLTFSVFSCIGLLGVMNKGPLKSILFQDSVLYRLDYWRAGLKMTINNPFFGVGLDSYGDWYRFYRDEVAALRRGYDVTSNSAHNILLDISSSGGFLLLGTYLVIIILVIRSGIRVLSRKKDFDSVSVGLVTSWLAYHAQSLVSINQLGLAVWGWVFGGAIIGYDVYQERADEGPGKKVLLKKREHTPASQALVTSAGAIIGLLVAIWPLNQDRAFKSAFNAGDAKKLEEATYLLPQNNYYYVLAAETLLHNKLNNESMKLAKKAIEANPRDFLAWKMLANNPKLSESEKVYVLAKMRELDPFNNSLGK